MGVMSKDVESAQRAFDVTSQRLSQTRIEGQAEQSDIAMLNPAVAPIEPDSPKIPRNVLLSIFLGIMLGCGIALLAELLDRRIRSDQDLSDVLQIPVFGVVDWKQKQRRPRGLRGLLPRRLRLN